MDFFDYDNISDSELFPTMIGQFRVEDVQDGTSSTGKRMPMIRFVCEGPEQFIGQSLFEYYVMGTDEAPDQFVTGSTGTKAFKRLLKKAQVAPSNSFQQLCAALLGSKVLLHVIYYEEKGGSYDGTPRNRISGMGADSGVYALGEREIGVLSDTRTKAAPGVAVPVSVPGPAAGGVMPPRAPAAAGGPPAAPNVPAAPVTGAAPPGAPGPAPAPAGGPPPAPVEGVPAQPAAAPAPGPAVPGGPAATPGVPATPEGGQTLRCIFCQKDISVVEYSNHVAHKQQAGDCPAPGTYLQ